MTLSYSRNPNRPGDFALVAQNVPQNEQQQAEKDLKSLAYIYKKIGSKGIAALLTAIQTDPNAVEQFVTMYHIFGKDTFSGIAAAIGEEPDYFRNMIGAIIKDPSSARNFLK